VLRIEGRRSTQRSFPECRIRSSARTPSDGATFAAISALTRVECRWATTTHASFNVLRLNRRFSWRSTAFASAPPRVARTEALSTERELLRPKKRSGRSDDRAKIGSRSSRPAPMAPARRPSTVRGCSYLEPSDAVDGGGAIVGRPCAVAFLILFGTLREPTHPLATILGDGSCSGESVASSECGASSSLRSRGPAGRGGRPTRGRSVPVSSWSFPGVDDEAFDQWISGDAWCARCALRARAPQHLGRADHRRGDRVHSLCVRDSTRVDRTTLTTTRTALTSRIRAFAARANHGPRCVRHDHVGPTSRSDEFEALVARVDGEAVLGAITERISMPSMYCSTSAR